MAIIAECLLSVTLKLNYSAPFVAAEFVPLPKYDS